MRIVTYFGDRTRIDTFFIVLSDKDHRKRHECFQRCHTGVFAVAFCTTSLQC